MTIGQDPVTAGAAQQLVERHTGSLGLQVPEGNVDRGDRGHGDLSETPVGAPVQELPGVFDAVGGNAEQRRYDGLLQVCDYREVPAVEGGVPQSDEAVVGGQSRGHVVAV